MEKQLEELLRKANGAVDKAIEMSPSLIESYIQYKVTWSILEPIILLAFLLGMIFTIRLFMEEEQDWDNEVWFFGRYGDFGAFISMIVISILSLIFSISLITSIHDLVLISISKEVYLINKFVK